MVVVCHVSLFFMLLLPAPGFCPDSLAGPPSAAELIALARKKDLAHDRYWHILLHYEKTLFGGFISQVDDPVFFLAPDGKTNPEAELEAVIATLFQEEDQAAEPFVCRFYARYRWLREALEIPPDAYSHRVCPEIDCIEPVSVTLVFPIYYLNNPASLFGHTLLAIKTEYENRRLAYAVNYAARADRTVDALSFGIKGLFGLYQGYYSVEPYYKKIQEYGDIHHRDIWEYSLNLTPEELKRLIRHVKEFDKGVYTDYFFFDENCSYNLLFLLEAARPSVDLVSGFKGPAVLPLETIKAIHDAGLITDAVFQPSKATRIRHAIRSLDQTATDMTLEIVAGRLDPASIEAASGQRPSPEEQAAILDLATEQLQYMYVKKVVDKETYQERFLGTLKARSRLGIISADDDGAISVPPRPDMGHDPNRISLASGKKGGRAFFELRYRPAFTDLLDMDFFHHQGGLIELADLRLRYSLSTHLLRLQQLDIIDIISLPGRDAFFKPLSWKVDTGFHRKPMANGKESLYYRLNGGTGLTMEHPLFGLAYAMVTGEADLSGTLEESFALGPGLTCGLLTTIAPFLKSHLYGETKWFLAGDTHTESAVALAGNLKVSKNNHFSMEFKWERVRQRTGTEVSGVWHIFF